MSNKEIITIAQIVIVIMAIYLILKALGLI